MAFSKRIDRAARLVSYFQSHARKVYAVIDADPRKADAKRVLRWVVNNVNDVNGVKVCSRRDIHAKLLGSRYSTEQVQAVANLLIERGYFRPYLADREASKGGRPRIEYEVHPSVFKF